MPVNDYPVNVISPTTVALHVLFK